MIIPETYAAHVSDEGACFIRMLDMGNVQVIARFTIDGEPASKARPRFDGRGYKARAFTPAKTKAAEQVVAWKFRAAAPHHRADSETAYGMACVFFPGTRQRRDVDNMLKLVADGLNGIAWADDAQVYEVTGRRGHDPQNPRTEVLIYAVGTTHGLPTRDCPQCGSSFEVMPSTKKRFCSVKCANNSRRKTYACEICGRTIEDKASRNRRFCSTECVQTNGTITLTCEVCGDPFDCYRSWQRKHAYCSKDECRRAVDARVHRERRTKSFPGECLICGAGTTRKEYRRCNPCKRANKTVPIEELP